MASSVRVRGQALIISNIPNKPASQNLKFLFERLRFEVHEENDLPANEIKDVVSNFYKSKARQHGDSDMCIVAILSSGKMGQIGGSDGGHLSDMDILQMFSNKLAPKLAGKPKLFIFTHRRGTFGEGCDPWQFYSHGRPDKLEKMFILSPAFQGSESYFNPGRFIDAICNSFTKHHANYNLGDLVREASNYLEEFDTTSYMCQAIKHRCHYENIGGFPLNMIFK